MDLVSGKRFFDQERSFAMSRGVIGVVGKIGRVGWIDVAQTGTDMKNELELVQVQRNLSRNMYLCRL